MLELGWERRRKGVKGDKEDSSVSVISLTRQSTQTESRKLEGPIRILGNCTIPIS